MQVLQVPRLLKLLHGVYLLIYTVKMSSSQRRTIKVETVIFADVGVPSIVPRHNAGIKVAPLIVILHARQVGYFHGTLRVHVQRLPGSLQLKLN